MLENALCLTFHIWAFILPCFQTGLLFPPRVVRFLVCESTLEHQCPTLALSFLPFFVLYQLEFPGVDNCRPNNSRGDLGRKLHGDDKRSTLIGCYIIRCCSLSTEFSDVGPFAVEGRDTETPLVDNSGASHKSDGLCIGLLDSIFYICIALASPCFFLVGFLCVP